MKSAQLGCLLAALIVLASQSFAQSDFRSLCGTTIRVGLRSDAPPFAFRTDRYSLSSAEYCGQPARRALLDTHAGYTVELCRGFLEAVTADCQSNPPQIETIEVAVDNRDSLLTETEPGIDLLCGATTATVTLRAEVPTSPYTFLTGTSFLATPAFLNERSCKVGVVGGTTSDASSTPTDSVERRLPGWDAFAERREHCDRFTLEKGNVHTYKTTAEAITDMSLAAEPKADLLLDDRHILQWHSKNRESFLPADENEKGSQKRDLTLLPEIITIEPYAAVGSVGSSRVIAEFSRYLTRKQGESEYADLLRQCFKRQVDRSFWFLMEFQSNVREGDFLPRHDGSEQVHRTPIEPEPRTK